MSCYGSRWHACDRQRSLRSAAGRILTGRSSLGCPASTSKCQSDRHRGPWHRGRCETLEGERPGYEPSRSRKETVETQSTRTSGRPQRPLRPYVLRFANRAATGAATDPPKLASTQRARQPRTPIPPQSTWGNWVAEEDDDVLPAPDPAGVCDKAPEHDPDAFPDDLPDAAASFGPSESPAASPPPERRPLPSTPPNTTSVDVTASAPQPKPVRSTRSVVEVEDEEPDEEVE